MNKIIIHHSLTPDSETVSWGAIRKWHMGLTGFPIKGHPDYNPYIEAPMRDIGYHWGIEFIGDRYEILKGRDGNGAHTIGQNEDGIGICVVGNFDLDPVTPELEDTLHRLLVWLIPLYGIDNHAIYGHCEFASKSCPGKHLFEYVQQIRK